MGFFSSRGPVAWNGEQTVIVTVRGKRYAVGTVRGRGYGAVASFWNERGGRTVGPTQTASRSAKTGSVAWYVWCAIR